MFQGTAFLLLHLPILYRKDGNATLQETALLVHLHTPFHNERTMPHHRRLFYLHFLVSCRGDGKAVLLETVLSAPTITLLGRKLCCVTGGCFACTRQHCGHGASDAMLQETAPLLRPAHT